MQWLHLGPQPQVPLASNTLPSSPRALAGTPPHPELRPLSLPEEGWLRSQGILGELWILKRRANLQSHPSHLGVGRAR